MINWFDVPSESPNKDLTLKNLQVTENGTYGESGVAYSSVEVNVNDGGGGESDVSTAIVTLEPGETSIQGIDPAGLANAVVFDEIYQIETTTIAPQNLTYTKTVVLYQGKAYLFNNQDGTAIESVSGNIEYNEDLGFYVITGDCTVILVRDQGV